MSYQPKGGMCASCIHKARDCSNLMFEYMRPVLKTFDVQTKTGIETVYIVKCDEFNRDKD